MTIPITIQSDEKGYFDRECPNADCLYQFKIKMSDWTEKVSDEAVHCPMCGYVADKDKWWTQGQLESIRENAKSYAFNMIQDEINKSFKQLERSTRNNKSFKIKYKPGRRVSFINNPIGQMPEWETEIVCPDCSTAYSVIGTAYFCPCCGRNNVKTALINSMSSIEKMIDSLDYLEKSLAEKVGKDAAKDMASKMLEDCLGNIVSAFQKYAELLYSQISKNSVKVNDFQIVEKGSDLFLQACGKGYDEWLSQYELNRMILFFQRRHILEHNAGIVDERYINMSGDTSYQVGQHIVLKKNEVSELLEIVRKLCDGLAYECDCV